MFIKEKKGALIVEASIVFPVTFFVLLFLIYMGNMFYMRSRVDALAAKAAIEAAACCQDPMFYELNHGGALPTTSDEMNDIRPYHAIRGTDDSVDNVKSDLETSLNNLGTGFFAGMGLKSVDITTFEYNRSILTSTFTVEVNYAIKFPIRYLGESSPVILKMESRTVAPVTDTGEFIQNIDMAMDFMDSTGLSEKMDSLVNKVKDFFD